MQRGYGSFLLNGYNFFKKNSKILSLQTDTPEYYVLMRTDYLSEMAAGGHQISVFVGDFPSGHYLLRLKVGWGVGTLGWII